jgi:cytochrome c oxidase cbb3-type subunit 3
MNKIKKKILSSVLATVVILIATAGSLLAQGQSPEAPGLLTNSTFITLLAIIIVLLVVIISLSSTIKNLAESGRKKNNTKLNAMIPLGIMLLASGSSFAQEAVSAAPVDAGIAGMSSGLFYTMITIIVVEFMLILFLVSTIKELLVSLGYVTKTEEAPKPLFNISWEWFNTKFGAAVPLKSEAEVMTDHEYDGIRELDNDLPPWWKYMFYITIIFAVVYLFHFHILKTGPSQAQEYSNEMAEGERKKQEYLKFAAANVDENTVAFINESGALANGRKIYVENNCGSCHGEVGEGNSIGPNLTDEYWLHGGSIQNIFKSIKYGITAKGMIAWQGQIKPNDMQDLASYIYSLKGSNPANAKEPQGELYVEEEKTENENSIDNDSIDNGQ